MTYFLPLIAHFSPKLQLSKLFRINAIIILYMDQITSTYFSFHLTIGKFGITKTQIWSLVTIWRIKKWKVSTNNILSGIFRNFIPYKIIKFDYKYLNCINPNTILSLRNSFKLSERYYSNPAKANKNLLKAKSRECSDAILKDEERYTN